MDNNQLWLVKYKLLVCSDLLKEKEDTAKQNKDQITNRVLGICSTCDN